MRSLAILLLFSTALFAAPVPKNKNTPPDEERILGTWEIIRSELNGKDYTKAVWEFQKDKMFSRANSDAVGGSEWAIKIDPSKSPKEIMIGDYPGIYLFDGDTLTICYRVGGTRPEKITSEDNTYLNVMKRVASPEKK